MSESPPPIMSAAVQPGLDLLAERSNATQAIWPLYDSILQLQETHFSSHKADTVVSVRPLRNVAYQGIVDDVQRQYERHRDQPIGPALIYRLAVLNLLANRPRQTCELIESAIDRAAHASDKTKLHLELARAEMERLNHAGALAAYRRLAEHDPPAFPFPLDRYHLDRVLGAGGFSTVFLCRDACNDAHVVVKSLDLIEHFGNPIDPFYEASLLEQLQHPGVVKLIAKGYVEPTSRQRPYLVLEYLPGMTLHDFVTRCGPLSWQNWLTIARQVLAAIQAVHLAGMVHRDLKPGNLLLQFESDGWRVKLIDFGIAVRQQFAAGTLDFAAPEQLDREAELGPALDVYAFGRTSCFAMLGQPDVNAAPFQHLPSELVNLIRECQAKHARSRPSIPTLIASIDAILARGWAQSKETGTRELVTPPPGPATSKYSPDIVPAEKTWIPEERERAMNQPSKSTGQRALVVESTPQARDELIAMLQELGIEAEHARGWPSGSQAFTEANDSDRRFDFVLISADLHSGTAIYLARAIRTVNLRVKLILLFDPQSSDRAEADLASEYRIYDVKLLAKPLNAASLRKILWPSEEPAACGSFSSFSDSEELSPPALAPITTLNGPASAAPPTPPRSIPSGELAMRGGPEDDVLPKTLPPWLLTPTPYDPPPPVSAPPRPAPPRSEVPGASSAHIDLPGKLHSAWELLQDTVGSWFKSKPSPGDRLQDLAKQHSSRGESNENPIPHAQQPPIVNSASTIPTSLEPQRDEVDCTLFAPPQITAGDTILVQAMVHLPAEASAALAIAQQFDDTTVPRGARSLDTSIERGARLAFQLSLPGLEIDDATPSPIVWRGRTEGVQFGVTAPSDWPARTVVGTLLVTLESVPIGQIKFKLAVMANSLSSIQSLMASPVAPIGSPVAQPHKMTRYQMVFISYASPDRDEVLKRVQMLKRFNVKFFQDVLNLEPGERWEQSLYKHIDESDLFLLFWSSAAKNSKWVREEVKYALGLRTQSAGELPEIVPIVLEGPPVPEPLPELAHLHFNDQILHFVADRYSSPVR